MTTRGALMDATGVQTAGDMTVAVGREVASRPSRRVHLSSFEQSC
jgi:hypothetical protein